jgi:hypothetical protein
MQVLDAPTALTEARIRRILALHDELTRRTKKDAKRFLRVDRMPEISKDETLVDVAAPQMKEYFAGWNEDPGKYFKDRDRLLMIFNAIVTGGVGAAIERLARVAPGAWIDPAMSKLKERGFGSPVAAEGVLHQSLRNAEKRLEQFRTISDAEERAVRNCMQDIVDKLFGKKGRELFQKLLEKVEKP